MEKQLAKLMDVDAMTWATCDRDSRHDGVAKAVAELTAHIASIRTFLAAHSKMMPDGDFQESITNSKKIVKQSNAHLEGAKNLIKILTPKTH